MARFSGATVKTKKPDTVNFEQAPAYSLSAERELLDIATTSKLTNQYYRTADATAERVRELVKQVDVEFAAKCAMYTRHVMGMRSISHLLAGEVSRRASGLPWLRSFYRHIVRRPDDMREIIACIMGGAEKAERKEKKSGEAKRNGHSLPSALKRGFAEAMTGMSEYQLGAYKGDGKGVSLTDVMRLTHPVYSDPLGKLVDGSLRSQKQDAALTRAGQSAETAEHKAALKQEVWDNNLDTLGYNALVMNCRNILQQAPALLDRLCARLEDATAIRNSLIQPLQIYRGYLEMAKLNDAGARKIMQSMSRAIDLACQNIPQLPGRTLVAIDDSGSMATACRGDLSISALEYAGLFAAMLAKGLNADVIAFSDDARYVNYDAGNTTLSLAADFVRNAKSAGTNMGAVFQIAKGGYDRVIVITDMQSWSGIQPHDALKLYRQKHNGEPLIYSFDVTGYGTNQFKPGKIQMLSGVSFGVLDLIGKCETDRDAILNDVRAVRFTAEWVKSTKQKAADA